MAKRSKNRKPVSASALDASISVIKENLQKKLKKHGDGMWCSRHEVYGIIAEEIYELLKSIHEKESLERFIGELADVAVGCLFGIASMLDGGLEW